MKKITNKFKPRDCVYKLGRNIYLSQPSNTIIRYYVQNEDGYYVAILRRQFHLLPVVALFIVIFTIMFKINHQSINIKVNVPTMMYLTDGMLSLDLDNESNYDILYDVRVEENSISNGIVKAKSSKSNVDCDFTSDKEILSAILYISYDGYVEKFNMSLTVNNGL